MPSGGSPSTSRDRTTTTFPSPPPPRPAPSSSTPSGSGFRAAPAPGRGSLIETQRLSCPGNQARVWSLGARLSAAGAAACNGYQIHNGEFDCVHEGAVVHTFTVPVAAGLAWAEREGGVGGRDFLTALALGVDVACHLGVASKSPLRFFRPATAGAFGAAATIGRLAGFDARDPRQRLRNRPRPALRDHAGPHRGLAAPRDAGRASTPATRSSPATWRRPGSPPPRRCSRVPSGSIPCSRASTLFAEGPRSARRDLAGDRGFPQALSLRPGDPRGGRCLPPLSRAARPGWSRMARARSSR